MRYCALKLAFVLSILIVCESISVCQTSVPAGWRKIDADGLFTFYLPRDFKKTDMQGIENYLGEYLKGETRFLFVHGATGSNAYDVRRDEVMSNYREVETKTDGRQTNIRTFSLIENGKRTYVAELNVGDWPNANVELYMQVTGNSPDALEMAKRIFHSIASPQSGRPHHKPSHTINFLPFAIRHRLFNNVTAK